MSCILTPDVSSINKSAMRTNVILAALLGVVLVATVIFYFANTEKSELEPTDSRPAAISDAPKLYDLQRTPEAKPAIRPEVAPQLVPESKQEPTQAPEPLEQTRPPAEFVPEHKQEPTPIPDDVRQSTPEPPPEPEPEPEPQPQAATIKASSQLYTVQKGDTLYSISKRVYGEGKYWREIVRANEKLIASPQSLQLGWELKLPPREEIVQHE
jgi:nucleoid-associated protein YgaU